MSPTVHNSETTLECVINDPIQYEMCESSNNRKENDCKDPQDRSYGKRKISNDESKMNQNKKKRKETENDTIISSLSSTLSSNSDDYGTDTELVAINHNKKKHRNLFRYAPLDTIQDFIEDTRNHLMAISETAYNEENLMCQSNYTISIDERSITSSTTNVDDIFKKILKTTNISNANTKHLFDIAISTFKLIKKNQEFQLKLKELKSDTNNFINSILENPENQPIKE